MVTAAEAVSTLNLGECESRSEMVAKLQSARAFQLEAIERGLPSWMPAALAERLRATRQDEVALCEEVLIGLGEPLEAPTW